MKQSNTKRWFRTSIWLLLLLPFTAFSQKANYSFKGTVSDDLGDPLPGVSVSINELRVGTVTDARGFYNLVGIGTEGVYTLEFKYTGFQTERRTVNISSGSGDQSNDIQLVADVLNLDEVIVTGNSAVTTRKQLGNSIGVVEGKKLASAGSNNMLGALSGKVMGAQISQNDGNPGGGFSIRLRGPGSIKGNSDPLYMVDGVIVDNSSQNVINRSADAMTVGLQAGQNRLIDLNPNDIDHIEVLNGASAAARYGSRAANGVVQIFTKKGVAGRPRVEFSTSSTFSSLRQKVFLTQHGERFGVKGNERLETAQDRLTVLLNLYPAATGKTQAQTMTDNGIKYAALPGRNLITDKYAVKRYDYQDEIFNPAFGMDNHLSVSGGSERSNYFASFGYSDNDGIVKNTNFKKYTGRLRFNQTLNEWATLSAGIAYTNSRSKDMPNGNNFFSPVSTMFIIDNVWDITERDANGQLKQVELVRVNPLSVLETFDISQRNNRTISDVQLKLFPVKGLTINALVGADFYNLEGNEFHPRLPYAGVAATFFPDGYVSQGVDNVLLWNHELAATYDKKLGEKFSSTTTAGYEIQNSRNHFTFQEGRDLAPFVKTTAAAANFFSPPIQAIGQRSLWGGFLQETFGYNDQIFVTLAGRVDGSSAFSKENQNIFYPKASMSWVLSDYWKTSGLKNTLGSAKVRASWGQAGNLTGIGAFDRFDNYLLSTLNAAAAIQPSKTLANPDVKPERKTEMEFGVDLGLFKNKIGLSFTVYNQEIEDLLLDRVLPATAGGNSIVTNIGGGMTNKGVELLLTANVLKTRDLNWDLGLNWSRNRNEVTGIDGVLALRGSDGTQSVISGQAFGVFYGRYYATNGDGSLLLTKDGLAQPERGAQTTILAGTPAKAADGQPSGTELRKILGDPNPDWIGSLSSNFSWKKLTFNFQFDAFWGADIYNWNRITGNNVGHGEIAEKELKGELPRGYVASIAGGVTGQRIQEEHIEDASYIKLREVGLGWNFGKFNVFQNLTFALVGRNLLSFDEYTGFDPETNSGGQTDRVRGDDFGNVPIPRSIGFRLNASF